MNISGLISRDEWTNTLNAGDICPGNLITSLLDNNYEFFWHPLGFAICKVARWNRVSLRIHVWPNHSGYQQDPSWLIHDHLFHLKSWVLSGEIENREYLLDFTGIDHTIYEAQYDGNKSILNKTSTYCSKTILHKSVYSKGDIYEVKSGVFHESRSLSKKVALTICETVDEKVRPPRILGRVDGLLSYVYTRRRATKEEILKLVKEI